MRNGAALTIWTLGVLLGCAKQSAEPTASRLDTPTPVVQVPQSGDGTHQVTPPEAPGQLSTVLDAATHTAGRATTIALRGQADQALRGQATLKEVTGAVEIVLNVQQASPGARIVALHDSGSCSRAERKTTQQAPVPQPGRHGAYDVNAGLGALAIDQSGQGKLRVTIPSANLGVEQEGSLLGKALVIYPDRRAPEGTNTDNEVLACAQILAN